MNPRAGLFLSLIFTATLVGLQRLTFSTAPSAVDESDGWTRDETRLLRDRKSLEADGGAIWKQIVFGFRFVTLPPSPTPLTLAPTLTPPSPMPTGGDDTTEGDVQNWLDATVTLEDGIKYEIVEQIYHDSTAFTQGLTYANELLYESTGLRGESSVRIIDPQTGVVLSQADMPPQYFGEGMTLYKDTLVQITWTSGTGFVYNAADLTVPPTPFTYRTTNTNQGWGITWYPDRDEFIVSDGSNNLIFWDPITYEIIRALPVFRQTGRPAVYLNELEFWRGRVLANVFLEDVLLVIHPETGVVEKEYDFSALYRQEEGRPISAVFNGISVSGDPQLLYVTGKRWNRMFLIKLLF